MSMQDTPSGERIHIGFFGRTNAGKSSLVNALTGQDLAVVSPTPGTTTDPVKKAMEILPLGPVVIIDTAGLDDEGSLGEQRIRKTREILRQIHIAVIVVDATAESVELEADLLRLLKKQNTPCLICLNKSELVLSDGETSFAKETDALIERFVRTFADATPDLAPSLPADQFLCVSASTGENVPALREKLAKLGRNSRTERPLIADLISTGDFVVLVTPIDEAAPKGRLILPQQMTTREILDRHATPILCQPEELADTLASLNKAPRMVVTDSQVFGLVDSIVPAKIALTSFSILMARYKGELDILVEGASALSDLKDGDRVLISEGCTHHRQCNDIGTKKLPGWISSYTGVDLQYDFTSGGTFPDDPGAYRLIVHCGGCMLNEKEMHARLFLAKEKQVPIVNYGVAIAKMHGILDRSLAVPGLL